jgi:hypothetical protein
MNCASDEAKNAIPFAISNGTPILLSGVAFTQYLYAFIATANGNWDPSIAAPKPVCTNPGLEKNWNLWDECHAYNYLYLNLLNCVDSYNWSQF